MKEEGTLRHRKQCLEARGLVERVGSSQLFLKAKLNRPAPSRGGESERMHSYPEGICTVCPFSGKQRLSQWWSLPRRNAELCVQRRMLQKVLSSSFSRVQQDRPFQP